jgi:hypothetical protein
MSLGVHHTYDLVKDNLENFLNKAKVIIKTFQNKFIVFDTRISPQRFCSETVFQDKTGFYAYFMFTILFYIY